MIVRKGLEMIFYNNVIVPAYVKVAHTTNISTIMIIK